MKTTDGNEDRIDVDAEWERMCERNLNRWRKPAEAVRQDTIEAIRRNVYGPEASAPAVERYDRDNGTERADGYAPRTADDVDDVEAAYEAMVRRNMNAWQKRGV